MHEYSRFLLFCKLHAILDQISKEKYDLPMQIKSLYLALFANFGHQSMHQVLQGTLNRPCFAWHPYGKLGLFKTELVISETLSTHV